MNQVRIRLPEYWLELTPGQFQFQLRQIGACVHAHRMVEDKTPLETWATCPNGFYMLTALRSFGLLSPRQERALMGGFLRAYPQLEREILLARRSRMVADYLRAAVDFYL